jgi:hypothetical protein
MQLLFATNYSLFDAFVEVIQTYAIVKEYVIVKSQSKAEYKFNIVIKVDIICERDDELQRKLDIK